MSSPARATVLGTAKGRGETETQVETMNTDLQDVARGLPDYHVDREIGRGEFGIVWAGRHRQLGRAVAIKQLAGPVTSTAEYSSRFRREARTWPSSTIRTWSPSTTTASRRISASS